MKPRIRHSPSAICHSPFAFASRHAPQVNISDLASTSSVKAWLQVPKRFSSWLLPKKFSSIALQSKLSGRRISFSSLHPVSSLSVRLMVYQLYYTINGKAEGQFHVGLCGVVGVCLPSRRKCGGLGPGGGPSPSPFK